MDGHLFDPDEYNVRGKAPKRPRSRKPKTVTTVPVRTSPVWRLVATTTPGVVHARGALKPGVVSSLAACGIPALPMSFDDGQWANGCARCFAEVESPIDSHDETGAT